MSKLPATPLFELEVNLDCPNDLDEFLDFYEPDRGRRLANALGFKGPNATKAANALMNYAQNKRTAIACRKFGKIQAAKQYEDICDRIYKQDIQPLIKCW